MAWSLAENHGSCQPAATPNFEPLGDEGGGGGGGDDGAAAIVDVDAETASVVPPEFVAATVTRTVLPASPETGVYDEPVALLMSVQPAPDEPQSFHWYAYEVGAPVHEPFDAFRAFPTCGVPETDGKVVLPGGVTGGGGGAAGAETTAVCAEVAVAVVTPLAEPVTAKRRVEPTSPEVSAYVVPVAPDTGAQLEPLELHRDHW